MDRMLLDDEPYITCSALAVGDYAGSASVGEANIRAVQDMEGVVVHLGSPSYRQAWLPQTEENEELVRQLEEDYPLVDDEIHSAVEMEWEEEAWKNWLKDDLLRTFPDIGDGVEDALSNNELWEAYRRSMEATNTYPVCEGMGAYIQVERIAVEFALQVENIVYEKAHLFAKDSGFGPSEHPQPDEWLVLADWITERGQEALGVVLRTIVRGERGENE